MRTNEQSGTRAIANRRRCDPEAEARRLVNAYANLILRLSFTYLKSTHDAQDICQSILLKLIERHEAFQSEEHEKAWVVRATANACKDALRNSYRHTSAPLEEAAAHQAPEEPEGSAVLDAVMELDEKYREAIYLHYYEGYSIAEIAAITGRSASATAAHLSRGRAKLRSALGETTNELGPDSNENASGGNDPAAGRHAPRAPAGAPGTPALLRSASVSANGKTPPLRP
ncbi:MAG: sigma-70 family RNA polymerase sigma factor [Slackia sp.]|nr:sigma-70 family RNA polymerase sigma factor [Slackia sp.]